MSVDLGVLYTKRPHSDEEAGERYVALCTEKNKKPWLEPSPSDYYGWYRFRKWLRSRFGGGRV